MSNALAIGAVSAVLRNILDNGLIDAGPAVGAPVKVSAVAPDLIKLDDAAEPPRLNLFLYRVTPNPGWSTAALPARGSGGERLTNAPLALDLHYLLTAYGKADLQAEILLGYGMHVLHERPWLDRATIRKALSLTPLDPSVLPDAFRDPPAAGLADQLDSVKVTWEPMNTEELSRFWSAVSVHYRPSAAYQVSVVLIEATRPAGAPLPVLRRGLAVEPSLVPPFPALEAVDPPPGQEAAELGDTVTLRGRHLAGTGVRVRFGHRLLTAPHEIVVGANTDAGSVPVTLPSNVAAAQDWPAGVWSVSAELVPDGESAPRWTNTVALLLAPTLTLPPAAISRDATTHRVSVDIAMRPEVRPEQSATLALNAAEATAAPRTAPAGQLSFQFPAVPAGDAWVRLRVDGVESRLVDRSTTPPSFRSSQKVTVPS